MRKLRTFSNKLEKYGFSGKNRDKLGELLDKDNKNHEDIDAFVVINTTYPILRPILMNN